MEQVDNLKQISNLSYFDINTLSQVISVEGPSLRQNIGRWMKQGKLIQIKRGLYTTREYYTKSANKISYNEFIANQLRYPSYLSLEYVLTRYQILTESVFAFTSITRKTTRNYKNKLGTYIYRNISDSLFTGFDIIRKDGFEIAIASKEKALFDYLYLKFYRNQTITNEMVQELRLNLDEFSKKDIKKFEDFCKLSGVKKYLELSNFIFKNYDN